MEGHGFFLLLVEFPCYYLGWLVLNNVQGKLEEGGTEVVIQAWYKEVVFNTCGKGSQDGTGNHLRTLVQ